MFFCHKKPVCLRFDEWTSNDHNELVLHITIITKDSDVYLVDIIDTSSHAYTVKYLAETAASSIKKCEGSLECHIQLVVTNNAVNVSKMSHLLETKSNNEEKLNAITHRYSSPTLNC